MIYDISDIFQDTISSNKSTLKTITFKLRFNGVMSYGVIDGGIHLQKTIF